MQRFPQVMINVEVADKDAWTRPRRSGRRSGHGRRSSTTGNTRASGTEPSVRVMVEAETEQPAREHAEAVAERVAEALG